MRTLIANGPTIPRVAGGKSLTREQNDRLREHMRELLRRHDGNQSALAPKLGVTQSTISAFTARDSRQGSSLNVAMRVAELLGKDVNEVLGLPMAAKRVVDLDDRYPNRAEAIAIARRDGFAEEAIAAVQGDRGKSTEDQLVTEWLMAIREEHLRLRRSLPAVPSRAKPPPDTDEAVGALTRRREKRATR